MAQRAVRLPQMLVQLLKPSKQLGPGTLAFRVPRSAGKLDLAKYFEAVYGMSVDKVNTAVMPGKLRRNRRFGEYTVAPWKKAYVRFAVPPSGGDPPSRGDV